MGRPVRRKERIRSFAPVARRDARVLILGSMPGEESLRRRQYYAYIHNAFWRIMGELLELDRVEYSERIRVLKSSGIALWDVLESCTRKGSSDTAIEGEVANDFARFFARHTRIKCVFFNGAKAEASFRRHVLPRLPAGLRTTRLPSTSPANASLPYRRKLEAWRVILAPVRTHRSRQ